MMLKITGIDYNSYNTMLIQNTTNALNTTHRIQEAKKELQLFKLFADL